jgi:outer membrane biosynthesis protein TonB
MKTGMVISALMHAMAVLAMIFGLPSALVRKDIQEAPIIIDLVTIDDITRTQKKTEAKKKPAPPKPKPKPKPKAKAKAKLPPPAPKQKAPPAPPKPKAAPPKRSDLAPPKPKQKPKLPQPKEPQRTEEESFASAPTPPAPRKRQFDTRRLAVLLDKSEQKPEPEPEKSFEEKMAKYRSSETTARSESSDEPLTMSEIDAIRYQIEQCWSVPGGARDAENLIVRIKVFLNPDGSLSRQPIIVDDGGRLNELFYRTAAESARRAVQKCSPLKKLPIEKYESWREITLTFNPRQMLGG